MRPTTVLRLPAPATTATTTTEEAEPLLPGWRRLEHVTPRRPARPVRRDGLPAARGRRTWGMTYRDPDLPPGHAPVTCSTGCTAQAPALQVAKRKNQELRERALDIERGRAQPKYLQAAHVDHHASHGGKRLRDAVQAHADKLNTVTSARHLLDAGMRFVHYCEALGVHHLTQITEELLLGFTRSVILEPCKTPNAGKARQFTTVDDICRHVKAVLRANLKYAPQLNSDLLLRGLPAFTAKKGGQAALVKVLHAPTPQVREWIMASEPPRRVAVAGDEGGRLLSQDELHRLLHAALRHDVAALRSRIGRRYYPAGARLLSVDIALLLVGGFRLSEYTKARCGAVQFGRPEPMDRSARTDVVQVFGKGRRWRDVAFTGYTAVGIALLRELVQGRSKEDWLSECSAPAIGEWLRDRLPPLGAPQCKPKDLRSTGCNFAQRLHHVPIENRAARWGHTVAVHTGYYLQATGTALKPAATLEASMGIERLLWRVVRLVQARNRCGVQARRAARHHPADRKYREPTRRVQPAAAAT